MPVRKISMISDANSPGKPTQIRDNVSDGSDLIYEKTPITTSFKVRNERGGISRSQSNSIRRPEL